MIFFLGELDKSTHLHDVRNNDKYSIVSGDISDMGLRFFVLSVKKKKKCNLFVRIDCTRLMECMSL